LRFALSGELRYSGRVWDSSCLKEVIEQSDNKFTFMYLFFLLMLHNCLKLKYDKTEYIFFDRRILITPFVSSNSSYDNNASWQILTMDVLQLNKSTFDDYVDCKTVPTPSRIVSWNHHCKHLTVHPVSCVPDVDSVSRLSILDWSFGFL
jgi:hypothetical protein